MQHHQGAAKDLILYTSATQGDIIRVSRDALARAQQLKKVDEGSALYRAWEKVWQANNGKLDTACTIMEQELKELGYYRNDDGDLVAPETVSAGKKGE